MTWQAMTRGAPSDRTNPLWEMLRALLESFRTATPVPVHVPVSRVRRRR